MVRDRGAPRGTRAEQGSQPSGCPASRGRPCLPLILIGCASGLIVGALIGALGLLAWGFESGAVISVGFGLLGLVYLLLAGGTGGGLIGSVLGALLVWIALARLAPRDDE